MISFLIVFVGLSVLVFVHELGHFVAAKGFGMLVEEFGIGFPPRLFSKKYGETRYSINAIPLGGFVKLHGEFADILPAADQPLDSRSFSRQKPWKRVVVLCAGVCMNFFAGWIIVSLVFWLGVPTVIFIDAVAPESPAARAGLVSGDIIFNIRTSEALSIEADIKTLDVQNAINFINTHRGEEIVLEIQREGKTKEVKVVPRENPPAHEGALGVALRGGGVPRQGFFAGLYHGFLSAWLLSWSILSSLYSIIAAPATIVGPVGIVNIALVTGQMGFIYLLQLLGVISLNLAVLNILPIPALDGGRLLFIIIEKLRGKQFSPHIENRVNGFGFAFLLALIVFITVKDIMGLL